MSLSGMRVPARRIELVSLLGLGLGCAPATPEPPPSETPTAVVEPPTEPTEPPAPSTPSASAAVEAMALRCDGPGLLQLGSAAVAAIQASPDHPSASLLATWEQTRAFEDGLIRPETVEPFVAKLSSQLELPPPAWWVETLKSARGGDGIATGYDLKMGKDEDRRGTIERGPGKLRTRPGHPLVADGPNLAYDLSSRRVVLGPLPKRPGEALEVTRAHAGTTLYVARFEPGAGGFRFPLRAVGSDGSERWTTEVCAADRQILGGVGYMIVELVMLEEPPAKPGTMAPSNPRGVAVFTAETHGVTVEVFDIETGERTLAWSSDLWSWRDAGP